MRVPEGVPESFSKEKDFFIQLQELEGSGSEWQSSGLSEPRPDRARRRVQADSSDWIGGSEWGPGAALRAAVTEPCLSEIYIKKADPFEFSQQKKSCPQTAQH